jgi:hypothetical protein
MTQTIMAKRPNCDKIIEDENLWALNEIELKFEEQLMKVFSSEIENKSFHINYIISSKFIEMKFKDNEISN